MNRTLLLALFFFCSSLYTLGSHIVGGEIEMIHKRGSTYQIILKMYADVLNADVGVIEGELSATVGIFQKSNNVKITEKTLYRKRDLSINYAKECPNNATSPIKTLLLIFYEDIILDDSYNHPGGYYISWQNCCRNSVIKNIRNPYTEGMAFYMEFPPVIKNGVQFYNNSPQFPQITGDYPCKNRPFTWNFNGRDLDGDSLVYKVATPLAGKVDPGGSTLPTSGPYPTIQWFPGYGITNQIPGTPAFNIHPNTGQISFTPIIEGLFVFSVIVEEYRDGLRIGMVQRDFQLLVDDCPSNGPTNVELKFPNGTAYNSSTDTLHINIEQDTCFSVEISDQNPLETISLKIIANTLPANIVTFPSRVNTNTAGDPVRTTICLNACNKLFITKDTSFRVSLVVTDAPKCPVSLAYYDTVHFIVNYRPQLNDAPVIGSLPATLNGSIINATIGKEISFDIFGTDTDLGDIISLNANGVGFDLSDKGMLFNNVNGTDSIGSKFKWTPDCKNLSDEKLKINFVVSDNSCIPTNKDTVSVEFNIHDTTTTIQYISPVNLFTPNGDGKNEVFEIPNIPGGNCDYFFKNVSIYNRWGARIYSNDQPDFKWDGKEHPSGLYFYLIDLNKKELKGWINIVR